MCVCGAVANLCSLDLTVAVSVDYCSIVPYCTSDLAAERSISFELGGIWLVEQALVCWVCHAEITYLLVKNRANCDVRAILRK